MFLMQGIISGIVATLIFDLYQLSLSYAYNIQKSKWDLIGRYFVGFKDKIYTRHDIENDTYVGHELLFGYIVHYVVGSMFGIFYVILNKILFNDPSMLLAIIVGFITLFGSWCIIMPFALNIGFFASKKDEQRQIIVQNLISHYIFGTGLFIGYILIN